MLTLRIIFAVLCFFPLSFLFGMGLRQWVGAVWWLGLMGLAVAQIFYPQLTKFTFLWLLASVPIQLLFPEPHNPWSGH